jgi:hypothetical protein
MVTVPARMEHTPFGVTVTVKPESDVGATGNVLWYVAGLAGAAKVMV